MSSLTPLLSPAKSPSSSASPKGKWRPWSVPVKSSTVSRTLCGQLNKLTNRNFDVIANRIAQLTWTVELSEDRDSLNALVRAIFYRGATDVHRQLLYALLCRRVIDVLEAERSRWRKVDSLHIGKSVQSFETVITLLATDEYNRIRGYHVPEQLEKLAGFLGELLVYGVVATANMGDILASLVEGAKRNDERMAVATCRFLFPITLAYNAVHILGALKVTSLLDQALKEDGLSPMVRYLMMGMLDRVNSPTPHHAFGSAQPRVDMYPTALDEYFIDDDDGGDADVFSDVDEAEDNEWMQRDCEDWAKAFLIHHDDQHLGDILHSLRPVHRKQLLRCLVSTSLYLGDDAEATSVGSLYSQPRIRQLCSDGKLFDEALCDELAILQDVRLDVPNAVYLMARVLHSTNINADKLRALVQSSMSSQSTLADELITETSRLEEGERMGRMGRSEEVRVNRFERTSSNTSCCASCNIFTRTR